jgi:hypothetical protein
MSIQIKTINLVEKEAIEARSVNLNGSHVQSVNIYQTDGSFITSEPFNNRVVWYPQNPNNLSSSIITEWKIFTSFTGYGYLLYPMDARFDWARRILWIADSGNKRVLKVEANTGKAMDVAANGYFANSLAINLNNGDMYVKSIKDDSTGIIQQYNSNADYQRSFEFPCTFNVTGETRTNTYSSIFEMPLPSSMTFDHYRNRLWWVAEGFVYMIDVNTKNIVPFSIIEQGFTDARSVDIDFESGNSFVIARETGYNSWYILQMFRDNNSLVSTAYMEKLRPSERPYGV